MKKGSKPPEVRRKELIDVAAKLFAERGYESVSVRDILAEVNGAPGMFYYYFKSKQDIYLATMEDYINKNLAKKCELLADEKIPFDEKKEILNNIISSDIKGYASRFTESTEDTISDTSYKMYDLIQMISKLIIPYSKFMLQGIEEGKIENKLGINEENAEEIATFILYGLWGTIYNNRFTYSKVNISRECLGNIINNLFYEN